MHLPILRLLCTGLALWAWSVKFRSVGHRFNSRSWVGTSTTCCKWPRHLVNGCARGKGVLWLSRSRSERVLWGCGRRRQCSTVHNMQLDISDTKEGKKKQTSFPLLLHNPELLQCSLIFSYSKWLHCAARAALSKPAGFSLNMEEVLKKCEHSHFICVGRQPRTGQTNLLLPVIRKSEKLSYITDTSH